MDNLSPRERVAIALAHQEPDKVPIDLGEGRATSLYVDPYVKTAEILGLGQLEIIFREYVHIQNWMELLKSDI